MSAAGDGSSRRDLLKKSALLGGAGVVGAALMAGLDRTVLAAPSQSSSPAVNQWTNIQASSCVVFVDLNGNYCVKDTGIGPTNGALIVDANVITGYGASLGAGTSGASTTTAGLQEAVNCLRGRAGLGGGRVAIAAGIYATSSTITLYPGIVLAGLGLLSAFQDAGTCAIQPASSLNGPVVLMVVDPDNTSEVSFPRCEGFAINGSGIANTDQDGIKVSNENGDVLDAYIKDVGVFQVGGNGLNIADSGGSGKYWVEDFYVEDCLQNGINQDGGFLRVRGGYNVNNHLFGISSASYQMLEVFEMMIASNVGGAVSATGATNKGVIIEGCRIDSNGGPTSPQLVLSGMSGPLQYFLLTSNKFLDDRSSGAQVTNHVVVGTDTGGSILSNHFGGSGGAAVDPGVYNGYLYIKDNNGLNPINMITNPFMDNHLNYLNGTAAVPLPDTDYAIYNCDMFVTSADSSNSDNAILVKDAAGNTVLGPVHTLAGQFVPMGYKINWGGFTGSAGAVTVFGN